MLAARNLTLLAVAAALTSLAGCNHDEPSAPRTAKTPVPVETPPAASQSIASSPVASQPTEPQPAIPGYEGDAKKVIDRAISAYQSCKSYQDSVTIEEEVVLADAEPDKRSETALMVFAAPNKLTFVSANLQLVSDGKTLTQYVGELEQYVVEPVAKEGGLGGKTLEKIKGYMVSKNPIVLAASRIDPSITGVLPNVSRITRIRSEKLDGRSGQRIHGEVSDPDLRKETRGMPFSAWFADNTGLLYEYRWDATRLAKSNPMVPPMMKDKIKKAEIVWRLNNVRTDVTIPDGAFAFKPGLHDEKVKEFRPVDPQALQRKLVGRPAPAIEGKDRKGKTFRLSEYKGKVVLLDFWASYCTPCIMAMPDLEKISKKYATKGVTVIGVNGDPPMGQKTVDQILERQKVTYRQVLDPQSKASEDYRVSGIPCLVFVDKKGIIREIHSGFVPDGGRSIAAIIDKLLK